MRPRTRTHSRKRKAAETGPATPAPEVPVTPAYRVVPEGAGTEQQVQVRVVDALEDQEVCVVPDEKLNAVLVSLAGRHGRAIDIEADDRWLRLRPDGTAAPARRPWSVVRCEQMRERDREDRALLTSLGQMRDSAKRLCRALRPRRRPARLRRIGRRQLVTWAIRKSSPGTAALNIFVRRPRIEHPIPIPLKEPALLTGTGRAVVVSSKDGLLLMVTIDQPGLLPDPDSIRRPETRQLEAGRDTDEDQV